MEDPREVISGVWRFEATHPEWTEDEGGEDGWDPVVAWYAVGTTEGLLVVDPLLEDPIALDALAERFEGCAGIVRTCHWHERSVRACAEHFAAPVFARRHHDGREMFPADRWLVDGDSLPGGARVYDVLRADELALLLPDCRALVFGDAMLRRPDGTLRVCPDSWTQPDGGPAALRARLRALAELPVEHVLVMHGPFVAGGGAAAMRNALT